MQRLSSISFILLLFVFLAGCSSELASNDEEATPPGNEAFSGMDEADFAEAAVSAAKHAGPRFEPIVEPLSHFTFYSDRQAFKKAINGYPSGNENLEGSNFPTPGVGVCSGAINQASGGNGCYPVRREIIKVFHLDNRISSNDPSGGLAVLTSGFLGVSSSVAGPNFFSDDAVIRFNGNRTKGAGFNIVDPFGGSSWHVHVYGPSGQLGVVSTGAGFVGFVTSSYITRIQMHALGGTGGELIDDLMFTH